MTITKHVLDSHFYLMKNELMLVVLYWIINSLSENNQTDNQRRLIISILIASRLSEQRVKFVFKTYFSLIMCTLRCPRNI